MNADRVLCDGRPEGAAAVHSRALHYGDGVFRTLLCIDGEPLDWPLHADKLVADCLALGLAAPEPAVLLPEVRHCAGRGERIAKIIVARAAAGRGYAPSGAAVVRWVLGYEAPPRAAVGDGIVLGLSAVRLAEQPLLAGIKHLNRLEQVLASRDWPAGVDELLMTDACGRVIGGTRSNLFAVACGRLLTPALDRCGVAGIMRRKILECGMKLGVAADIVDLDAAALGACDEVFVCNAVIGIWPVRALAQRRWAAPGPVTRALIEAIAHPRGGAA